MSESQIDYLGIEYVKCPNCTDWSTEDRIVNNCYLCKNNSGWVINPKFNPCNSCGGSLSFNENTDPHETYGLVNASVTGGYSSSDLTDLTTYKFSICELCLRKLFKSFKIPPKISGFGSDDSNYEEDHKYYEYRVWCQDGLDKIAYEKGLCNTIKDCTNEAKYSIYISDEFTTHCICEEHTKINNLPSNGNYQPFVSKKMQVFI